MDDVTRLAVRGRGVSRTFSGLQEASEVHFHPLERRRRGLRQREVSGSPNRTPLRNASV